MVNPIVAAGRGIWRNRGFIVKAVSTACVAAVLCWYSGWAAQTAAADAATQEKIDAAQRSTQRGPYATDGTFTGSAQGYGGTVTSEVVIKNGYIESARLVDGSSETAAYLSQAKRLYDDVVSAQSTSVDTVSGATFSSAGILNGLTQALSASNAGGGE